MAAATTGVFVLFSGDPLAAQSYLARGVAGLPSETRIEFAQHAEPLWELVEGKAKSIGAILAEICGNQGAEVNEFLASEALALNRVDDLKKLVPAGRTVAVPFCFKIETLKEVRVLPGDTVEELLKAHYGVYGPRTQAKVYELNADDYPGMDIEEFETHLRPDTKLILPYGAEERLLTWDPGSIAGPTPLHVVSDLAEQSFVAPFAAGLVPLAAPSPFWFQSVPFVEEQSLEDADNCAAASYDDRIRELVGRFRIELELLTEDSQAPVGPTVVGVVDSGLARGDSFFADLLAENSKEKDGTAGRDDDDPQNNYVDDIHGISLERPDGTIYSSPTDDPRGHGTKIATVAATGLDFIIWRQEVAISPIALKMVSYSSNEFRAGVAPTVLTEAPLYLAQQGAAIVNMSLSNPYQPNALTTAIDAVLRPSPVRQSGPLFVVAAGNEKNGGGKRLGPHQLFPALYGGRSGEFARQVITVGAHDGIGRRASYSNYSEEYVDLLAPGCSVKTRDEQGNIVYEHGTSMATAAVTFTAGVVHYLGLEDPVQIKNRLLAATDYDPALAASCWSSGRLNVRKAISLRTDVVELGDGLRFGEIVAEDLLLDLCETPPPFTAEGVRKVIPNLPGTGHFVVQYWGEWGNKLHKESCVQKPAAGSLVLRLDDDRVALIPIATIRDIVPARL